MKFLVIATLFIGCISHLYGSSLELGFCDKPEVQKPQDVKKITSLTPELEARLSSPFITKKELDAICNQLDRSVLSIEMDCYSSPGGKKRCSVQQRIDALKVVFAYLQDKDKYLNRKTSFCFLSEAQAQIMIEDWQKLIEAPSPIKSEFLLLSKGKPLSSLKQLQDYYQKAKQNIIENL